MLERETIVDGGVDGGEGMKEGEGVSGWKKSEALWGEKGERGSSSEPLSSPREIGVEKFGSEDRP